ncbi:MAG: hypothetical protein LBT66_04605 [Methanobrevibacter sp.]|jgi:hypothetical protein|nr:hypothetical protein [Candidatus Methanovirga meridionalis]
MINLKCWIGKYSWEERIGILLFLGSIITLTYIVFSVLDQDIHMDELFSLNLINFPYFWVMGITAADVHPPLYYFILKGIFDLFTFLNIPFNCIILGKIVSLIPIVLLLIFNLTVLKKKFGWLFTGIFALFIVTMPQIFYGFEIRMYSFAFLFITLAYFYAYNLTEESKLKNWVLLIFFTLMAAYTHYYAGISSIFIFLLLLAWILLKNRIYIKKYVYSVIILLLLYLPWISVLGFLLINQWLDISSRISWINPINLTTIINYMFQLVSEYGLHPVSKNLMITSLFNNLYFCNGIITFILLSIFIILLVYYYKSKYEFNRFILTGFFVLIFTLLFGVIVSLVYRPVFIVKYIIPALGALEISFAFLLSKLYSKKKLIFTFVMILFIISATINVAYLIEYKKYNQHSYNSLTPFLNDNSADDLIIYDHAYYLYPHLFSYIGNYKLVNLEDTVNSYNKMISSSINDPILSKTIYTNDRVWISLDKNHLENFSKKLNENNYKIIEIGNTSIEMGNVSSQLFFVVF